MKTTVLIRKCPFCHKEASVGIIENKVITICLCSECLRCWEVIDGKVDRLIRYKSQAETADEFSLCPVCWREMKPDYEKWIVKCPDPICGHEKRLTGLSMKQIGIKKEFEEVQKQVFELMNTDKEVPEKLSKQFKELQTQYNKFRDKRK